MFRLPFFRVDVEPTNRCNADCSFCPRHMTPHEGLMAAPVFDQALKRVVEFRNVVDDYLDMDVGVSMCGLGEPLLHPQLAEWVERVRQEDLLCTVSSNGAVLDERRGEALLAAGLQEIYLNVGARDESYEEIYDLPWERTRDNVLAFAERAAAHPIGCEVHMVLVDHQGDGDSVRAEMDFWRSHGITNFLGFGLMNRGGALETDHNHYDDYPGRAEATEMFEGEGGLPRCNVPAMLPFIGYDGLYYLCCSDWVKEASFGHVDDLAIHDLLVAKARHVDRRAAPCATCSNDPLNHLTMVVGDELTDPNPETTQRSKDSAAWLSQFVDAGKQYSEVIKALAPAMHPLLAKGPSSEAPVSSTGRRLIPVTGR